MMCVDAMDSRQAVVVAVMKHKHGRTVLLITVNRILGSDFQGYLLLPVMKLGVEFADGFKLLGGCLVRALAAYSSRKILLWTRATEHRL